MFLQPFFALVLRMYISVFAFRITLASSGGVWMWWGRDGGLAGSGRGQSTSGGAGRGCESGITSLAMMV